MGYNPPDAIAGGVVLHPHQIPRRFPDGRQVTPWDDHKHPAGPSPCRSDPIGGRTFIPSTTILPVLEGRPPGRGRNRSLPPRPSPPGSPTPFSACGGTTGPGPAPTPPPPSHPSPCRGRGRELERKRVCGGGGGGGRLVTPPPRTAPAGGPERRHLPRPGGDEADARLRRPPTSLTPPLCSRPPSPSDAPSPKPIRAPAPGTLLVSLSLSQSRHDRSFSRHPTF